MTVQKSKRARNKEVERLVRNFLLDKRLELARKVSNNKASMKALSQDQRKVKQMLADINRQIDELGIRIKE